MTLKVAFIGNGEYYKFLSDNTENTKVDWDWQVPLREIQDFYDALRDGSIDQATPMIIIDPALYDKNDPDHEFEKLIATMAPYALVQVIAFSDPTDTTPKSEIQSSVARVAGTDQALSSHFYWIDADDIIQSMDDNVGKYVNAPDSAEDAAGILSEEYGLLKTAPDEGTDDDYADNADPGDDGTVFNDPDKPQYINSLGRRGRVISVTSAKGGSGKSTVAYSLAQEIGKSSRIAADRGNLDAPLDVCLVDMDVYDGQLGFVIGASSPTMLNIANQPSINQETVGANLITNDKVEAAKKMKGDFISFSALLAPKSPKSVENTPPGMWREVINVLTTMFDIIILDTSVMYFLDPIIYEVAYPESDEILYVTDLDIKSILDTTKWLNNVCMPKDENGYGGFGIGIEKVGVVINKGMKGINMGPDKIRKILEVATKAIYKNIDKTVPVDKLPVPPVLTMIPSFPKLITAASNTQNLGAIIDVPQLENKIRRLAKAVVPRSVADSLEDAAKPELREEYERKLSEKNGR